MSDNSGTLITGCLQLQLRVGARHLPPPHSAVLELLRPFIKFVLLHPSSPEILAAGSLLHRELLAAVRDLSLATGQEEEGKPSLPTAILQLLVRLLPLQPLQTDEQLSAVATMARELVDVVVDLCGSPQLEESGGNVFLWLTVHS